MAAAGAVIVSGMADGLDAIAAAGALNAGGETVAVLGCGIDVVYPRHHTRLAAEIAQSGAIVTEFAPGTPPNGWNFPIRNRLISGLSGGVLVVEAGERSGAMITARYAVVQGKPLFAVPGDVTAPRSVGTNSLLANGALPALSTDGLLSHFRFLYRDGIRLQKVVEAEQYSLLTPQELRRFGLRIHAQEAPVPTQEEKPRKKLKLKRKKAQAVTDGAAPVTGSAPPDTSLLTPRQKELYAMLPAEPFTVDALTAQGVPVAEAVSCLTVFEIYGLLASRPGGTFEKK
jgi:DNA processing protein